MTDGIRQGFMVDNGADPERCFRLAAEHGFDFLELNADHQFDRSRVDADGVRTLADEHGLDLVCHLPYRLDACSPRDHVREGGVRELEAAIDHAAAMGAGKGVFHLQTLANGDKWTTAEVRPGMYETARRLTGYAAERGVEAVAENLKSPFFDAGDLPDLFAETDASACLDTGHAFVTGQDGAAQADLIREHGDRIGHLHLNDTRIDGDDEHLPVGMGKVAFDEIADAMRETGWEGTCTHELFAFDRSYAAAGKERFDSLLAGV
ncbi:sugar phosphate isomerase/epimerase family protein [Halorarum salinum]|uniref:Sugar phosphate isomerase/epimerase n=1 Tax=Halorarum salinum TaxID=2743089 RepID=A0A7D5LCT0_9EURY|nr:sugar phosphate isomerase/epimerase [Halobaculum salinum]QLG63468.1 sugar phosphate isomerase/epimerase [Halobaculum salinum]